MQASEETTHYGRINWLPNPVVNLDLLRSPDQRKRANQNTTVHQPGRELRLGLAIPGESMTST